MKAFVTPSLLAAVVAGLAVASAIRARQESHDAEIRYVGLSFDGSEVLSVDRSGAIKRWHAASGRYLGAFARKELRDNPAPWVKTGPYDEVLVPASGTDHIYRSFGDPQEAAGFKGQPSAFAPPDEVVTVIGGVCLGWSSLDLVSKVTRHFCWKPGIQALVVDASGDVHALDRKGNVVTVGGASPTARREVAGGGPKWTRLAASPSGATLVVTDDGGKGGVILGGDEKARPLPASIDVTSFGFLDEETIVFADGKGLRLLNLVTLQEKPYADLRGSAIAASARHGRVVVARGKQLYMLGRPGVGGARTRSWRLRDFLF
jgi:hypothetical protein